MLPFCTLITHHTRTRRVKEYTRFVGKYVTGRRKRFRPYKVRDICIFIDGYFYAALRIFNSQDICIFIDGYFYVGALRIFISQALLTIFHK